MSRGVVPLAGSLLLVAVTVVLAALFGTAALGTTTDQGASEPVVLSLSATADGRIELRHEGGPTLDVETLAVKIEVNGVPLDHQPPVPFFSATGFSPGPTGPFNSAADPHWEVGERATLRLAGTNAPLPSPGATITVRILRGELPVVTLETTLRS